MRARGVVRLRVGLVVALGAGLVGTAVRVQGQTGTAPERLATGGLISSLLAAPVSGQPFSAVQVTRTVQKLADGTTVRHGGHHNVARDADGRVRVEMRMKKATANGPEVVMVFVTDPVAGTLTTWVTGAPDAKKVAAVVTLPKNGGEQKDAAGVAEPHGPQPARRTEDLGTEVLDGLNVGVTRTTTVIAAGQAGNDAPITKTHEVWTSADLKLVVKQVWTDPRTGERTVALEHFSRAEPDPGLFHPPQGYEVKSAAETLKEAMAKIEAAQEN